jgi:hypothetical protein
MWTWKLPEKSPDETGDEWCRRAAESIPAEELMRQLVAYLMRDSRKFGEGPSARWSRAWSFVSDFTGHGSGISAAIVRRFLDSPPAEDTTP